ncbi:hypothetical protein D9619_007506 [Psilocybe cf. subviscida]|uniref:FAD/NAD(P)-binding domain-containing protein n=1 Tax=Psilocybe cf. subviscida TaxID=2480587 RepID=A0A8H5B2C0_9AGAR|nr:hypothetical protein D9619_007506 [Psilocybe cf. subviscida]
MNRTACVVCPPQISMSNSNAQAQDSVLHEPIGIIGAGVSGLISAQVLLKDGFTDITLISRDNTVGGTWARERVYPGLFINNVHGEYRYSALPMPPPDNASKTGGRLSGLDMCNYFEQFSATLLKGKAKFLMQTEVLNISRTAPSKWRITVRDATTPGAEDKAPERELTFSRIILASGGCSNPKVPTALSQASANQVGFGGLICHSSQFASQLENILSLVPATLGIKEAKTKSTEGKEGSTDILIIGGGKSAQDAAAKLTNEGRRVTIVYKATDAFLAAPAPLPGFIRKSRIISVFNPHMNLNSRLERFLHTTTLGSAITRMFWNALQNLSHSAVNATKDSPLYASHHLFWSIRVNDTGTVRPDSFHSLAHAGLINIISPARATGYGDDGKSVRLSNGQEIKAKVVILATGYQSSWAPIFTTQTAEQLGIAKYPAPMTDVHTRWDDLKSLQSVDRPASAPENAKWMTAIYRGIVPAKNIAHRDFAVAGGVFSSNIGYTNEVVAHWTASYFRGDKMKLPDSPQEAITQAEQSSLWMKVRYPDALAWVNESYSGSLDFFTWPQAADELLDDMHLPTLRSGGNWFNWIFKPIDLKEIENLAEERRERRISSLV